MQADKVIKNIPSEIPSNVLLTGFLCTSLDAFDHPIRIGYGGHWDDPMEHAIRQIGTILYRLAHTDAGFHRYPHRWESFFTS